MTLADYVEIRRRINSINGVEFDQLKKLLKALYLLGVDIGQMRGEMCESEKERANEVYGPTGDDVREDYVCLPYSKETIQVIFFQIPILRKRLKGLKKEEKPSSRLVALPKEGDIWTLELYNYFKEAGDKYVFPFTREDAQGMVAKAKPFDSLKYLVKERKDTPIHEVDFTMRYLPDVREQELKKRYKFEVGDLQAYGLRVRSNRLPDEQAMFKYIEKLWRGRETSDSNFIGADSAPLTNKAPTLQELSNIVFIPEEVITEWEALLEDRKQIIFYGPPGTGKTFIAENFAQYFVGDDGEFKIIQFHPSYSYEDFVEGIRPKIAEGTTQVEYEFNVGILKALSQSAISKPEKKVVLLIDEINRGNIAKIFGELIHCLDRGEKHKLILPYTQKPFFIPNNLYLIGTMNSADRSIALVDYALRRRFCFIDFMPDEAVLQKWLDQNNTSVNKNKIVEFLHKINLKIRGDEKLGKHFQVGHSYFMRKDINQKTLEAILKYNIIPLMEEYYFEDKEAITDIEKIFSEIFNASPQDHATNPQDQDQNP